MHLSIGSTAPAYSLKDQHGNVQKLSDFAGRWLVLYFYPKDDTPGCTTEACGFRDFVSAFKKFNAAIIGVSTDTIPSHQAFAGKFSLPFTLLADTEKGMVHAYGVWGTKSMYGKEYQGVLRITFLIDPTGTIAKIYDNVNPATHAKEILNDLKKLSQE